MSTLVLFWHAVDMHYATVFFFFPVSRFSRVGFDPTSHKSHYRHLNAAQQKRQTVVNNTNNSCCLFRGTISRAWVLTYFWANVDSRGILKNVSILNNGVNRKCVMWGVALYSNIVNYAVSLLSLSNVSCVLMGCILRGQCSQELGYVTNIGVPKGDQDPLRTRGHLDFAHLLVFFSRPSHQGMATAVASGKQ